MIDLKHGDSVELISEIEPGSIDALITDPPYQISTDFEIQRDGSDGGKWGGRDISHDFGDWDKENLEVSDWLPLFEPLLHENSVVVIFYDYLKLNEIIDTADSLGWEVRQPVVWYKQNPPPQGYAVKWQEGAEIGMICTVNEGMGHNFQKEEGQRKNVIETPICLGNERKEHPTQKPKALLEPILRWWTGEEDTILDPFAGTGTTAVVSKEMGRDCIAIEREKEYYEIMENRLRNTAEDTEGTVFDY